LIGIRLQFAEAAFARLRMFRRRFSALKLTASPTQRARLAFSEFRFRLVHGRIGGPPAIHADERDTPKPDDQISAKYAGDVFADNFEPLYPMERTHG
jgi:hypothetical protein